MAGPKDPKDLPPEDRPDYQCEALLKKLGLIHDRDVAQVDGEFLLLRDEILQELGKDLHSVVDVLVGKSSEEIEAILRPAVENSVARLDVGAEKILRAYFGVGSIRSVRAIDDLPCAGQTTTQVQRWVETKPLRAGDLVAIRTVCEGVWRYKLAEVKKVNHGQQRRIIVDNHGAFYRNGKSCHHPKGHVRLIEPTPDVKEAAEERIVFCLSHDHLD